MKLVDGLLWLQSRQKLAHKPDRLCQVVVAADAPHILCHLQACDKPVEKRDESMKVVMFRKIGSQQIHADIL